MEYHKIYADNHIMSIVKYRKPGNKFTIFNIYGTWTDKPRKLEKRLIYPNK